MPIIITMDEFREYVEANVGRIYRTSRGREFFFELLRSNRPTESCPYTIIFKSPDWSTSTVRRAGPAVIERFLEEFNSDNNKPATEYRNLGLKRSSSASARYLVILFRDLATSVDPVL